MNTFTDHKHQAITTRYIAPTNKRYARMSARSWAGRITVPYDHEAGIDGNHRLAAEAFANKMGWTTDTRTPGDWAGGTLHDQDMVWVWVPA